MAVEDYITIPELPEATSLQNADLLPIRDSLNGIDKKLTYANLQAQIVALFRDFASIYDNAKSYKLNAVVEDIATGILYKSLVDSNLFSLTDTSKWKRLGDLSLIEEYLTTSNIANKYLKLNLNGRVDNNLLPSNLCYPEAPVFLDSLNYYVLTKNTSDLIVKIENFGREINFGDVNGIKTVSFTFPRSFTDLNSIRINTTIEGDVGGDKNIIWSNIFNITVLGFSVFLREYYGVTNQIRVGYTATGI
jgi:hypothetical protein